jgi:hypothetical protein
MTYDCHNPYARGNSETTFEISNLSAPSFDVYPNPVNMELTVSINHNAKADIPVLIYTEKGEVIMRGVIKEGYQTAIINTISFADGLYNAEVKFNYGKSQFKRFLVIHK